MRAVTEGNLFSTPAKVPETASLTAAWTNVLTNYVEVVRAATERNTAPSAPAPYDIYAPARAMSALVTSMWADPVRLLKTQQTLLGEWVDLWTQSAGHITGRDPVSPIVPEKGDRRFNDPAWREPYFDYLKQAYLLATRQTLDLVAKSDLDPAARTRVDFFARQLLNAIAPTNFAFSNPEAIKKALDTGGVSLVSGLANMLADAASPSGLVKRRSEDDFGLGVTIAATPGSVIFENEMMQLIQYAPSTEQVFKRPLLYMPPLVNKYYVLDLQAKSSMIRWLVEQGHSVFVISWVNPGPALGHKGIEDYIVHGAIAALETVEEVTGERTVDMFGFCMGGTLLAITAAYLNGIGQADRLGSVSLIGALLDFTDTGEWATFYEREQMEALERHVKQTGVIGADKLQALFSVVRSNDLIWSSVVSHYLLDRIAPASDLLFWFADGARIPQAFLLDYGKSLLQGNSLKQAGAMTIDDVPIDLRTIALPVCMISLKDDHVSSWRATYAGARLFGGPVTFILGGSGHNAGVINPPAANKHGYWTNSELPETPEQWFDAAENRQGSWWPAWQEWLVRDHPDKVAPRVPGAGGRPILEPAPGSYVRVK